MKVLAIDTSADAGSIVLLDSETGAVTETAMHSPEGHSSKLLSEIQALLARAGVPLDQIDCFAAAAGPGSFTGVRIALSAAKGLAMALGKPMAAISNMRALAWFGAQPLRATAIDARRGDVFLALFDAQLQTVHPEEVTSVPDAWFASVPAGVEVITSQPAILPGDCPQPVRVVPAEQIGRAVAHLALDPATHVDPAIPDANYVRRGDAELRWVDSRQ